MPLSLALVWTLVASAAPGGEPCDASLPEEVGFGHLRDRYEVNASFLVLDETLNQRVREIGERVGQASGGKYRYSFRIVNTPLANAWATAGGYVYVTSGLLDLVEDADELASVLAHEITHNNELHLIEHIRSRERAEAAIRVAQVVLAVGAVAAGASVSPPSGFRWNYAGLARLGLVAGGLAGSVMADVILRGYAKADEIEADRQAVAILIEAGYDPYAMIRTFEKMKQRRNAMLLQGTEYATALINKEPGLEERIEQVKEEISRAQ